MSESNLPGASLRTRLQRLLLRLPPVQRADARIQQVESEVLQGLKERLDGLDGDASLAGDNMHQLLEASLEQNQAQARQCLVQQLLAWLTPDEARLLAAMSDGSSYPLLTLYTTAGWGKNATILHRHSNVGRAAGIQCNELIAYYLTRLFSQGLVISGPMQEAMRTDYELCEGDSAFRAAREQLEQAVSRVKTQRETLHISPVGRLLWETMTEETDVEEGAR